MKIAITGHTAGIGAAFARRLEELGHEIVGISKRQGNNIRNIPKVLDMIAPCDMWINNAQSGYAQTELLHRVWDAWRGDPNRMIWIISTMITTNTGVPDIPGHSQVQMAEYKNQKRALEDAFYALRSTHHKPRMLLIRPGMVDTQGLGGADVDQWTRTVCDFYSMALDRDLWIDEISLGNRVLAPRI